MTECLLFPLLAQTLQIPYIHFKTITPEHSAIISAYVHSLLKQIFKNNYKNLFYMLDFYPVEAPSIITTYKLKAIHKFINNESKPKGSFFKLETKILHHKILSFYMGRTTRLKFRNIYDGKYISSVPNAKIETDMIKFFGFYFSDKLKDEIKELGELIYSDF
jgi:hypothetical protein